MKHKVYNEHEFEQAFSDYLKFKPVKITKDSKAGFQRFIIDGLIAANVWFSSGECIPLVRSYKFKRTS